MNRKFQSKETLGPLKLYLEKQLFITCVLRNKLIIYFGIKYRCNIGVKLKAYFEGIP